MSLISREELKGMKPGDNIILKWSHPSEAVSTQSLCSHISMNCPELNLRLRTKKNRQKQTITITAERKEDKL